MVFKNLDQKSGVTQLRERFFKKKKEQRPSPELEEAVRKIPASKPEMPEIDDGHKKVAHQ